MRWKNIPAITLMALICFTVLNASSFVSAEDKSVSKPVAQSSDGRFQDLGNGTVHDSKTQLMWMKEDCWQLEKRWVSWYSAQEFVRRMNNKRYAGHTDWRLPTPDEAHLLYDRRRLNQDKDGDKIFIDRIFPKGAGWGTWTSEEKGNQAVVVSFKDEGGQTYQHKITGQDAFLRLVRGPAT